MSSETMPAGEICSFQSGGGAAIYQIPIREFPILWGYAYLVLTEQEGISYRVLIDTGSGYGASNEHLEAGIRRAGELSGQDLSFANLTHVLITHGHIDHFGGLSFVRPRTSAQLGVHELDLRNLTNHEERLAMVARRLEGYLIEAGVLADRVGSIIQMYTLTKNLYTSVRVDFTYEAAGMRLGPFEMLHVPGHCAGHVVIRLHDILFSGDQVLADISPHQSPEHLTLSTGLQHYLTSLDSLQNWAGGVRLTLGGHQAMITDLPRRIAQIRDLHRERLQRVSELLEEPHSIAEISRSLFGEVHGYNILLALEETGAHVEYLYQRGQLGIANLQEIAATNQPKTILYQRLRRDLPTGSYPPQLHKAALIEAVMTDQKE
jgi:glyoxylase-like metal-dependent hydrolase (beta-lactamase superfamily II)